MTGIISSLPNIISKESISFSKSENELKFDAGPTSPRPGPKLVMQAIEAEKDVVRS